MATWQVPSGNNSAQNNYSAYSDGINAPVDGNTSTYWFAETETAWWQRTFNSTWKVSAIKWYTGRPNVLKQIEYYDGSSWNTCYSSDVSSNRDEWVTTSFSSVTCSGIRVTMYDSAYYASLDEIEFYVEEPDSTPPTLGSVFVNNYDAYTNGIYWTNLNGTIDIAYEGHDETDISNGDHYLRATNNGDEARIHGCDDGSADNNEWITSSHIDLNGGGAPNIQTRNSGELQVEYYPQLTTGGVTHTMQGYLRDNQDNAYGYFNLGVTLGCDDTAPDNPNVSVSSKTNNSVSLSWTVNDTESGINYVRLYFQKSDASGNHVSNIDIDGDGTTEYSLDVGTNGSYTINGLENYQYYRFYVRIYDNVGNYVNDGYYVVRTDAALPQISTENATNVSFNNATLNGTLDDDGGETCDVYFEWGVDTSYGNTTSVQTANSGEGFSEVISGLNEETTYHYRAVTTNSAGTDYGSDISFTTWKSLSATDSGNFDEVENINNYLNVRTTFTDSGIFSNRGHPNHNNAYQYRDLNGNTSTVYNSSHGLSNLDKNTGGSFVSIHAIYSGILRFILSDSDNLNEAEDIIKRAIVENDSSGFQYDAELLWNIFLQQYDSGGFQYDAELLWNIFLQQYDSGKLLERTPALDFNGNDDYVNCGNDVSLQITGNQTIEFWIKPANVGGTRKNPINKAYGGEGTITEEDGSSENWLSYYYGTAGSNTTPYQGFDTNITVGEINNGEWYHVTIIRDLDNMKLYWYINGSLDAETDADYSSAEASPNDLLIGDGYTNNYDGIIDEVRIWNTARTQSEIQDNMYQSLEGNESGLVAYYPMNTGNGSTVFDKANNNDGTIYGANWVYERILQFLLRKQIDIDNLNSIESLNNLILSQSDSDSLTEVENVIKLLLRKQTDSDNLGSIENIIKLLLSQSDIDSLNSVESLSNIILSQIDSDSLTSSINIGNIIIEEITSGNITSVDNILRRAITEYDIDQLGSLYNIGNLIIDAIDESYFLNRFHSDLDNAYQYTTLNKALDFDGINDFAKITENFISSPSGLTVEGWIKPQSGGDDYRCALHKGDGSTVGNSRYWFGISGANYLTATIGAVNVGWSAGETNVVAEYGTWYHLCASWDGSTVRVFVNGEFQLSYSLSSYNSYNTVTRIGASSDDGSGNANNYQYCGLIDEVGIWNIARTQSEIQDNMYQSLEGNEEGLVAYYKMNEGEGSTAYDSAGNNDGTIYGANWVDSYYPVKSSNHGLSNLDKNTGGSFVSIYALIDFVLSASEAGSILSTIQIGNIIINAIDNGDLDEIENIIKLLLRKQSDTDSLNSVEDILKRVIKEIDIDNFIADENVGNIILDMFDSDNLTSIEDIIKRSIKEIDSGNLNEIENIIKLLLRKQTDIGSLDGIENIIQLLLSQTDSGNLNEIENIIKLLLRKQTDIGNLDEIENIIQLLLEKQSDIDSLTGIDETIKRAITENDIGQLSDLYNIGSVIISAIDETDFMNKFHPDFNNAFQYRDIADGTGTIYDSNHGFNAGTYSSIYALIGNIIMQESEVSEILSTIQIGNIIINAIDNGDLDEIENIIQLLLSESDTDSLISVEDIIKLLLRKQVDSGQLQSVIIQSLILKAIDSGNVNGIEAISGIILSAGDISGFQKEAENIVKRLFNQYDSGSFEKDAELLWKIFLDAVDEGLLTVEEWKRLRFRFSFVGLNQVELLNPTNNIFVYYRDYQEKYNQVEIQPGFLNQAKLFNPTNNREILKTGINNIKILQTKNKIVLYKITTVEILNNVPYKVNIINLNNNINIEDKNNKVVILNG